MATGCLSIPNCEIPDALRPDLPAVLPGFDTTSHDIITVDSVAGNTVTVTIVAEHTDGSSQTYRGSYVVSSGVIESASVQASS